MVPASSLLSKNLKGVIKVDSDKSISHRALMLSAICIGESKISNILESDDVLHTAECLRLCGVKVNREKDGTYSVTGVGLKGLKKPKQDLYFGNSGTSVRLFMGLLAGSNFECLMSGDKSLNKRPMSRVFDPLREMGVSFLPEAQHTLPIKIVGSTKLMPIHYEMPVASAQVKSAIMIAALNAKGVTTIHEKHKSRDHTEIMLKNLGADVKVEDGIISVKGGAEMKATNFSIPGDPSSAAFFVAAALITEGSEITIEDVCVNHTRTGFYDVVKQMGGKIEIKNKKNINGESVATITAKYSKLKGIEVDAKLAPRMIDEYPILAILATFADGRTRMDGLKELTMKESNRLAAIANGLSLCGVSVTYNSADFSLTVFSDGSGIAKSPPRPIVTDDDHRIAMSFLIAGLATKGGIKVDDTSMIKTSFPSFVSLVNKIGGTIN